MKPFVQFKDFTFKYSIQAEPTLKSLNLAIERGQKVLVVGPSGSGKSTIDYCPSGIIPNIHHGEESRQFTINGKEAFGLSIYDKPHLVSTVLQDPDNQFIGLTVAEDLAFALENDCVSLEEMQEKVAHQTKKLDLTELSKNRPQDLSGGQKQRINLAGVLIDENPILLFDEPLVNLGPKSGQETIGLTGRVHHEGKATTTIVKHRSGDVLYRHVDKVILVNGGQILFDSHLGGLLRTELLIQNGIRGPLYVTALKDLGVDMTLVEHLSDPSQIDSVNITVTTPGSFQEEAPQDRFLAVEQLYFAYQENRPILKNINSEINQGEQIATIGKSGAGKSALTKAICQFITPEGDIRYQGQSVMTDSIKEHAGKIGYVLQDPNQMINQTMIFGKVALGLRLRGVDEQDVGKRVSEMLKVCGLYELRKWPVSALSLGQKKRVTIASVLVMNPKIILLDGPTVDQGGRNYTEIMNFLNQLNKAGHTIIVITHDVQLVLECSGRSIMVSNGEIIADCSPVALFDQNAILKKADLKRTSLLELTEKLAVDPIALTHYYIEKEGGIHG